MTEESTEWPDGHSLGKHSVEPGKTYDEHGETGLSLSPDEKARESGKEPPRSILRAVNSVRVTTLPDHDSAEYDVNPSDGRCNTACKHGTSARSHETTNDVLTVAVP